MDRLALPLDWNLCCLWTGASALERRKQERKNGLLLRLVDFILDLVAGCYSM